MASYLVRGNVLTESDGTSVKSYTYNEFDGRASYTLKVNNVAIASETYAYDAARQLASVTTDSVQVTYSYDMNGNRTNDVTFNKTTGVALHGHNYYFDGANRVVHVQGMVSVNNGASLLTPVSETYTYNLDGSMATKDESGVTTSYVYDGAGRLTTEISGGSVTAYTYDYANNRTMMSKGGVLTTYTYDANNRMLTETEGGTVKYYTYDANGNQLTGDGATYTYNARGQQATYSKNGVTASYTYLPTGMRKSKTVGATMTNFVWDGQNMVYEYKGTNTTGGTAYYYGLTLISQGNYAYYLYNGHGDVVQLVTASNTLGRSYDYDAFGNEVSPSASDTNPFRYAGQYFDSETGTYYLRARYYDPSIGRFTQRDNYWNISNMLYGDYPQMNYEFTGNIIVIRRIKPCIDAIAQSHNLYIYCCNDPINYFDSQGENKGYSFGKIYDLGNGWSARFDRGVVGNMDHVHVYSDQSEYVMNLDGTTSHENKSDSGSPPNRILKKLKKQTGFDYKETRKYFLQSEAPKIYFEGMTAVEKYSDGSVRVNGTFYYNYTDGQFYTTPYVPLVIWPFSIGKSSVVEILEWLIPIGLNEPILGGT